MGRDAADIMTRARTQRGLAILLLAFFVSTASAANVQSVFSYQSTISSDSSGALDLKAELNYDNGRANAPIAVVMHGYTPNTGNFTNVRANAQRLRDAGFFVVSVAMRGRDGSDGVRDSGGLEVYDIYDSVEAVKSLFPSLVDPTNVHITGYSGGGANTMSALTKFPDYFRAGSSYFGLSDYGYGTSGWYYLGADSSNKAQLVTEIGNPVSGGRAIKDRYMARASVLASHNNPYSEIHLFVNSNEPTCPPVNDTGYRDNAVSHASETGEFENIHVHIGNTTAPTYQDFDGDSINDPNEYQIWPHGFPTADQQAAAEGWYLNRLLNGQIPQPVLKNSDELFVAGFVKTKQFELRLGTGENAAGTLNYKLSPTEKRFNLSIATSNQAVGTKLWIETTDMNGKVDVFKDNVYRETIVGGAKYLTTELANNSQIALRLAVAGDYNKDGQINSFDYDVWRATFGSVTSLAADGNGDGVVNGADYAFWRDRVEIGSSVAFDSVLTSVPEPSALGLWAAILPTFLTGRAALGIPPRGM